MAAVAAAAWARDDPRRADSCNAATVGTVARPRGQTTSSAGAGIERGERAMLNAKSLLSVGVLAAAALAASGCSVHTTTRPGRVVVHETRPAAKIVVNRPAIPNKIVV